MSEQPTDEGESLLLAHRKAMDEGNVEEAEQFAIQFMAYVVSKSDELKCEDLEHRLEAHRYEDRADWQAAEREYKEALVLAVKEGNKWNIWKSHSDLSRLYSLIGQDEQAFEEAKA